jgi:hypothetical protein
MLDKYVLSDKRTHCRIIDGETVILNLKDNAFYFLNPMGSFIWNLADGKTKVNKIIAAMLKEFDVDYETAEKDASSFIKSLSKKGILNLYDKPQTALKS